MVLTSRIKPQFRKSVEDFNKRIATPNRCYIMGGEGRTPRGNKYGEREIRVVCEKKATVVRVRERLYKTKEPLFLSKVTGHMGVWQLSVKPLKSDENFRYVYDAVKSMAEETIGRQMEWEG